MSAGGVVATRLLTDRQREHLAALSTRVRLAARTIVYREDTPALWVFIIGDGAVKSFRDMPSGKRQIAAFLLRDDVFGLAEKGRYVNTTQTITRVALYRIPIEGLVAMLRHDAELQFQFLCKVTHALRESQRQTLAVGRRDATGRLAMFFSMLERHAPQVGRSTISIPMSRSDIAHYLGLSLEAVSRASSALVREGLVRFDDRHTVRVVDRKRFDALRAAL